ncbi:MAG: hypothetical protein JWM42_758 [Burkholderia sp.]|nr:hypothetical protein [Burkholderia sp.]
MAWTAEHRRAADRRGLRYPSDLTDGERTLVAPLIRGAKRGSQPRTVNARDGSSHCCRSQVCASAWPWAAARCIQATASLRFQASPRPSIHYPEEEAGIGLPLRQPWAAQSTRS